LTDSIVTLCHLLLPPRWPLASFETFFLRRLDAGAYFTRAMFVSP